MTEPVKITEMAFSLFRSNLSPIQSLLDDETVTEIMLNRPDDVWVERHGVMSNAGITGISARNMLTAVSALASANNRDVTPVLDCRMPGYRIAAVLPPVGVQGAAICIRKHAHYLRPLDAYRDNFVAGRLSGERAQRAEPTVDPHDPDSCLNYVRWLVTAKKNILLAGSTGSGKTTFLNTLLSLIPETERVYTIEDTAELQVTVPNFVSVESLPDKGITIRTLVREGLRFRPDRIIVGEVRGEESYDLLDAMNTGHSGGACTLHANSAADGLYRLEGMVRMAREAATLPLGALRMQIAKTFSAAIFCGEHADMRGPDELVRVDGVAGEGDGYRTTVLFDASVA
ncbi:MAG TPA: ATPase, T2SS/T4P/T4SS family [Nevskiaceae bacterium]|nr:ATPase, T2SS/T4P/T4SS family [Nevskiaceae bacterium]